MSERRVVCITPTFNRQHFLRDSYACFTAQTYPHKIWVVIDSSPEPSKIMQDICRMDSRVSYVHVPDRRTLARTVPDWMLALCRANIIEDPAELLARVQRLRQTETDRIRCPEVLTRPTIGEKRNLATAIARALFPGEDLVISHKDDDDYYGPEYLKIVAAEMANADWAKLRSFLVHVARADENTMLLGRFGRYDHARENEPCLVIEGGHKGGREKYVVYADANDVVVADWGQAAFFGFLFNYSLRGFDAAGGFFPLNRAEDIHFYRGLVKPRHPVDGALRMAFIDAPDTLVCRLCHAPAQRTLVHDLVNEREIPLTVRVAVRSFARAALAGRDRNAHEARNKLSKSCKCKATPASIAES